MENFKKIIKFALPYKKHAFLNMFFNILYALFATLSMMSLMPMMKVLFENNKAVYTKPEFNGFSSITGDYLENYLNYFITINNSCNLI